jgi:formate/nitrite transporter FocA (FNT family)
MHMHVVHNAYTPKEATEQCSRAGKMKANMRLDKMLFSSFLAGCLLAFACASSLSTNTAPWYQENAPGLIRMLGAVIFPWGLCAIVLTGADLCTGSFMVRSTTSSSTRTPQLIMRLVHNDRRSPPPTQHPEDAHPLGCDVLWQPRGIPVCCWPDRWVRSHMNLNLQPLTCRSHGGVFDLEPYKSEVFSFNEKKVVTPEWHMIFLRGIGANWLVCLACYGAFLAREYFSKIVAIWWPTFAFVCLGFDHVVANMFFVPMSIFLGDPQISVGYYIWKSMIPALLGNIVGGGLMVGVMYWYLVSGTED